jgi:ATP synthase in type III secretion protein N
VVATSDAPPLERLRAAQTATSIAEYFREQGKRVLLLIDSITRFARAQREIGLAAGEPPTRRGFPPSAFTMLPKLLERAGQGDRGSITAVYTVLVEGGDMDEPIADEARGILDGHVVLDRELAARGLYPAVKVTASLSRVMGQIVTPQHTLAAQRIRAMLSAYESRRDLIAMGAYERGSEPDVDLALAKLPQIESFFKQTPEECSLFATTVARLSVLAR